MRQIYEFDFAFSFAGEDRVLVEDIRNRLSEKNYRVFYDNDYQVQLLGEDLYRELRDIYRNKGKFVVCFISDAYMRKKWTNLEFTAVKERFLDTFFAEGFLILILIDNAPIMEDIPSFIGFYRYKNPDETVDMLRKKFDSYIEEDNLIANIYQFITHMQERVVFLLCRQHCNISQEGNLLIMHGDVKTLVLRFSTDVTAQLSCVMIFEHDNYAHGDMFPALIITWRKSPHLRFFVHIFSEFTDKKSDELTFDELAAEICSYIKGRTGNLE